MTQDPEQNMRNFLMKIQNRLLGFDSNNPGFEMLDAIPLVPGQAIYVFNWNEDSISYQRGIEELLGYNQEEFTRDLVTSYFHPDEFEMINRLIMGSVSYVTGEPVEQTDFVTILACRIRKKNGEYIKILRQSILFELSGDRMISNYSILSDISFLDTRDKVEWRIEANEKVKTEINKHINQAFSNFFSKREIEILEHLKIGSSSQEIADLLFISKNTVDTHRRNMLRKAGCINTTELVTFARDKGVL